MLIPWRRATAGTLRVVTRILNGGSTIASGILGLGSSLIRGFGFWWALGKAFLSRTSGLQILTEYAKGWAFRSDKRLGSGTR
ncbi:hypothetical protein N431DRAFT_35915 [Stipitochalara longipes BDJ]|nr:hypothetical protein N431DRAFT_35915 [Stipitochalara longipes BDJ]